MSMNGLRCLVRSTKNSYSNSLYMTKRFGTQQAGKIDSESLRQEAVDHERNNRAIKRLIYEGKLTNRILYLKSVSLLSSAGLAASYGYVLSQKGISVGLAGLGFAFSPFLLSPFVIAWFFKRYITHLYYDPISDTYTAHSYGLLLGKRSLTFKREDVVRSDVTSMLNTFTVNKKPFFLHDEDLIDVESIQIYKRMIGLDQEKS